MPGILHGPFGCQKALILAALTTFTVSCGQSGVRPSLLISTGHLPRPARILVPGVLADQATVKEYDGILRQYSTDSSPVERRRELRATSASSFEKTLIDGLRQLGFTVARVPRGTPVSDNELLIDARCLTIDQGNTMRRLVVGFGSGASKFEAVVSLYHGSQQRKLMEFAALADSGRLPGAVVTFPAGAVVQGGVSTGLIASNAAGSGISAYLSEMSQLASYSAEEAARYLSEFFGRHRWIAPDQVKKARIVQPSRAGARDAN